MTNMALLVLNGPGMTQLADFATSSFDVTSLGQIQRACEELGSELGVSIDFRQTDDPDQMAAWIRNDADSFDAVIINQLGCMDACPLDYAAYRNKLEVLAGLLVPVTEVHLTNVFRDDPDRYQTLRGPAGMTSLICGLGIDSYLLAIRAAADAAHRRVS